MSSNIKEAPKDDEIFYMISILEPHFIKPTNFILPDDKLQAFLDLFQSIWICSHNSYSDPTPQDITNVYSFLDLGVEIKAISKKEFQAQRFYLESVSENDSNDDSK